MNTAKEFWSYVKHGRGCWEWQGAVTSGGYGNLLWRGKPVVAHRVAAYLSGMRVRPASGVPRHQPKARRIVMHTCDNMLCCRPAHLEVGTHSKNQKDCYARKRRAQPQGSAHANAKLNLTDVIQIRRKYRQGVRQVDLAYQFGVSQRAISLVVRGETYR